MRTIHHPALGVRTAGDGPATPGLAVVIDGGRIAALGPYETVLGRYGGDGGARVRAWDGVLEPGRYAADAAELLEGRYWPDPREAAEFGTGPLPAASVAMTDTRWGASARRGVQRLLARGVTAVAGPFARPQVAAAVRRAGLRARAAALAEGGAADFAVFPAKGADESLATVLAGRLVHRRA
ncbi:imidazolonepropionase-like domain-containing protein [Streptomyces tremellae]|uniref:Aminodeoxyfutalosine deaminase/Imidazolonepropionase-like composite domain-containing protein n=1 Tax=Streptomyces tremellae TaxID=1124239 RepID=A0ABP7GG93_9ACTN